jgi:subfamily B ATP-binding cassette protein MsbA
VKAALDVLLKGRTTLIIAHRLSTIQNADKIVVLSHGCVVETGTHNELLARDGIYARLYETQAKQKESEVG